jgi:hypothetical protein
MSTCSGRAYEWIGRVLEPRLAVDATPDERTQFERAASLSRFFGGAARERGRRGPCATGTARARGGLAEATRNAVAGVRRRGCRSRVACAKFAPDRTGHVYLDYTGSALYPASSSAGTPVMTDRVLGNPHSERTVARQHFTAIETARS